MSGLVTLYGTSRNISTDGSKAAGVYTPSEFGGPGHQRERPRCTCRRPLTIVNMAAIALALWRIFFGFSSGGLSMWRFE